MKLEKIEILELALPMITTFETSFGVVADKHTVLVKATDADGVVGYGEAPALHAPLYTPETSGTAKYILETFLAPAVLHKEFETVDEFVGRYKHILGHNFAKCGLQQAVWHIVAQKEEKSLKELFGGTQERIAVGESLGIKSDVDELLEEVQLRLDEGYVRIKVKIKPGWDLEVTKAIRDSWPDIDLMVDGNSAYTLDYLETFKKLDKYNLTMIEQPLAFDDIIDHATLQKELQTPICLDESIHSPEDARKAIEIGACKIINIKPPRVGGMLESIAIHDIAQEHGVGVWCGGMLETGIGRAFNIAVSSLPNYKYAADMSPFELFYTEDIVDPSFKVEDGYVAVPNTAGLGYPIQEDRVAKYTIDTTVIS